MNGSGAAQGGAVSWIQSEHFGKCRERFVTIAPFGIGFRHRKMRRQQFRIALNRGLKGNQCGICLPQTVASHSEKEEDVALRRRLMRLFEEASGLGVIADIESPLALFERLPPP